jgi:Ni/Co efflux regulator RcnB
MAPPGRHHGGARPTNSRVTPATINVGDNGRHRGWNEEGHRRDWNTIHPAQTKARVNNPENGRGRTWRAANPGEDNNGMRGHGTWRPANNSYGRNNARQSHWNGPQNWRNDRVYWRRYHRSWHASRRYHWNGSYVRPAGFYYRSWTLGAFLPAIFFAQQYWIPDYAVFALDPPPPGTVWVRYGDDALLVDRYSGEVIQVVYGIFY